jgi:hypothetical protein
MRLALKATVFACCFAAGLLVAIVAARDSRAGATSTVTETVTTNGAATDTAAATTATETETVVTTVTVQQTTTRRVVVTPPAGTTTAPTTTSSSEGDNGIPTWIWVVIGLLVLGLLVLLVLQLRRPRGLPPERRRRILDDAVHTWTAQGWGLERQGPNHAVLRRGTETLVVTVDDAGNLGTERPDAWPAA